MTKRKISICKKCKLHWESETFIVGKGKQNVPYGIHCGLAQDATEIVHDIVSERCPYILEQTISEND